MKYLYEFIGTFFLVFTVGMTVLGPNAVGLMAPLAIGTVLAVMIYAGGHISGGHYNPAVSLSVYVRGKLSSKDLGLYWIVQFAAAVVAAYLTMYLKGFPQTTPMPLDAVKALLAEFVFTFALCYVVLNVATAKETKGNSYFGLAIGLTVFAGACAVGAVSSAAFNPAVAFGMNIMNFSLWSNFWIFIVANFLGGLCAAWVFKATHKNA